MTDACVFLPLSQGLVTVIDYTDFEKVRGIKWSANKKKAGIYAYCSRKSRPMYLSRFLLGEPVGVVDHKNGDKLDNRRENLRVVSVRENILNSSKRKDGVSKYKGVSWSSNAQKWEVTIRFDSEEEAARAYDKLAREYYGGFARLNFPEIGEQSGVRK